MTPPNIWGNFDSSPKFDLYQNFDFQALSGGGTRYFGGKFSGSLFSCGDFSLGLGIEMPSWLRFDKFYQMYQKYGSSDYIGGFLNGTKYSCGGGGLLPGIKPSFTLYSSSSSSSGGSAVVTDPATESEKKTYAALKQLLDGFAEWYKEKTGDDCVIEAISEIEKTENKYTIAQKIEKLKEEYNKYKRSESDKGDYYTVEDYIIDNGTKTLYLSKNNDIDMEEALERLGIKEVEGSKEFVTTLIEHIDVATEEELNLSDLNGNYLITRISNYNNNTQKNFIDELCAKDFDNPKVRDVLNTLCEQLIAVAKVQCNNLVTDNKFYETLAGMPINSSTDKSEFAKEFNKVYAYTRILAARSADLMFTRYYGLETTMFSDKTKADLTKEKGIDNADLDAAEKLELKPTAFIGDPPAVTPVQGLKKLEGEGKAQEALNEMSSSNCNLLIKDKNKIKVGGKEYETYTEMYGTDKKTYIAVAGEIHTVTQKDGVWTDAGKIEDWQNNIQKRLLVARNAEANATENVADEIKIQQQREFELVKNTIGVTQEYGTITINDYEYNVYKSGEDYFIVKKNVISEIYKLPSDKIEKVEGKNEIRLKNNETISEEDIKKYHNNIAVENAKTAIELLQKNTTHDEWKNFTRMIESKQINEYNIIDFIITYDKRKGKNKYNLFSQVLKEYHSQRHVMASKLRDMAVSYFEAHIDEVEDSKKTEIRELLNKLKAIDLTKYRDGNRDPYEIDRLINKIINLLKLAELEVPKEPPIEYAGSTYPYAIANSAIVP